MVYLSTLIPSRSTIHVGKYTSFPWICHGNPKNSRPRRNVASMARRFRHMIHLMVGSAAVPKRKQNESSLNCLISCRKRRRVNLWRNLRYMANNIHLNSKCKNKKRKKNMDLMERSVSLEWFPSYSCDWKLQLKTPSFSKLQTDFHRRSLLFAVPWSRNHHCQNRTILGLRIGSLPNAPKRHLLNKSSKNFSDIPT